MNGIWVYGPVVLSAAMMLLMLYTSAHMWLAHKRAIKANEDFIRALDEAKRIIEQPTPPMPEQWRNHRKPH